MNKYDEPDKGKENGTENYTGECFLVDNNRRKMRMVFNGRLGGASPNNWFHSKAAKRTKKESTREPTRHFKAKVIIDISNLF